MSDLFAWIGPALIIAALALTVWWYRTGPSPRTRAQVALALESKGLSLISVKPKFGFRLGRGSRALLVAKATNPFGNVQAIYFDVDVWADLFLRRPNVRELGGYLGTQFMSVGEP